MKKYNLSEIMKKAWNIFRSTKLTFSECLKRAWAKAKSEVAYYESLADHYFIPDWFMDKNYDKMSSAHLVCSQYFRKSDIIRETEKALYVCLEMVTKRGHDDSRYTRNVWIPKSIVK